MHRPRSGQAATARLYHHFSTIALITLLPAAVLSAANATVSGVVVDQSGQPLPRASVRALDSASREIATALSDESGHFRFVAPSSECNISASLTGFAPATAPCSSQLVRVVLAVAPIRETVVVTPTRTAAPAQTVGASLSVFTEEDLTTRQTPLAADLLRAAPGVVLNRSGGLGNVTSLFVRGGESNYNKVLLDGIPLNEPGGTFNFSNLTTTHLERVELVRGAQSVLFGSDAMASVVQLFTAGPDRRDQKPHAAVSFEGGTFATTNVDAAVSGASGRVDYLLGVGRLDTDNQEPNNTFSNTTLSANVGVMVNATTNLRFIARAEREHVGTPGQTAFGRPDLDAFFERHDGVGGISFDQQTTPSFRQRAAYSLTSSNQQSTNLAIDPPYTPQFEGRVAPFEFSDFTYDSRTKLHRHHASYQADWRPAALGPNGDHLLTFLADWDGERARLEDALASTGSEASRNNEGFAVQDQMSWRKLFVTAGGRVEHNDSFGTAFVPRGSVVYVAHPPTGMIGDTRLKASAGLGIKEPTVLQSFSTSPFFLGNPDLEPEHARSVEAGIEQRFADDRAKVELTWFANRFENLIATRTISFNPFRSQYFNIGLTSAKGLELSGDVAPVKTIHARAGYTLLVSEVIDSTSPGNVVFQPGQWLFRRPRHSGFLGVTWHEGRITADLNGIFVGSYVDSDFSSLVPPMTSNPGYTTWAARVAVEVSRQWSGTLSIDNLLDADYMEALGYRSLGRAIRAGLRVHF
jgi:vitamin B12 transporter